MNKITFSMLFILVLLLANLGHSSEELSSGGDKSPSGKYYSLMDRKTNIDGRLDEGGWLIYIATKDHPDKHVLILDAKLYAEVKWSQRDNWFALLDRWDGHRTDLYVFQIVDSKTDLTGFDVKCVYRSPDFKFGYTNTIHWNILSWNMSEGTIKIQCKFWDEDYQDTKTCIYDNVPFCPPMSLKGSDAKKRISNEVELKTPE